MISLHKFAINLCHKLGELVKEDKKMAFKIIVCAKQVPDTNEIKIDPVKKDIDQRRRTKHFKP